MFNIFFSTSPIEVSDNPIKQNEKSWIPLVVFTVLMIAFNFYMAKREKDKQKEKDKIIDSLKIGDKVLVNGMVVAIKEIKTDGFIVNVGDGVFVLKTSINSKYEKEIF